MSSICDCFIDKYGNIINRYEIIEEEISGIVYRRLPGQKLEIKYYSYPSGRTIPAKAIKELKPKRRDRKQNNEKLYIIKDCGENPRLIYSGHFDARDRLQLSL